jgi:8-amino-7-oxononanoate synthase
LIVDGRDVLCLCSNNYLGLAGDPRLAEAIRAGLDEEGIGSGASRLISGSMAGHRRAEEALARFVGRPAAALFSTGYACNVGVVQALVGRDDLIFSDILNHASLIDGARLSRATIVVYRHNDPADLRRKLQKHRHEGRAALIMTESLFSMDGDLAPLGDLASLADEFGAGLLVDDAHALGVYGAQGRGLSHGFAHRVDVVIGTLGKALGAHGAFVAASADTVELIRNRARSYIFSTAPAPALARAAEVAAQLVEVAESRRTALHAHAQRLRAGLHDLGYRLVDGDGPIIPVLVGDSAATMALSQALLARGIFAHGIRPPTVPPGTGRLRVVPMATHSEDDIDEALAAFAEVSP